MRTVLLLFLSILLQSFQTNSSGISLQLGRIDAQGRVSIAELKSLSEIGISAGEEWADLRLRFQQCTVIRIMAGGDAEECQLTDSKLTQQVKWQLLLQRIKPGDRIMFEDVRARSQDGVSRMLGRWEFGVR